MIEHAVYGSRRSQQRDGYQIVATSPGAKPADLRELAVWCPSHDGLAAKGSDATSLNAFPLPSGAYCVARSFSAAVEYSGRGGVHVVTHALILVADDYARFARNPFAVMQAAVAGGHALSRLPETETLTPFELVGRARTFDRSLVRQVCTRFSALGLMQALDACLAGDVTAVVAKEDAAQIMAALVHCLPVGFRSKVSLATGLVYSSSRPYEWFAATGDTVLARRLGQRHNLRVAFLPSKDEASDASPAAVGLNHAWAGLAHDCLQEGRFVDLERRIRGWEVIQNVAELDRLAADALRRERSSGEALQSEAHSVLLPAGSAGWDHQSV